MRKNQKIKICIISTIFSAHIIRWASILQTKGFDITIISSDENIDKISHIKVVECLTKKFASHTKNLIFQFIRSLKIRKIIRDIKPDIVHIHSLDYVHPFMFGVVNLIFKCFPNLVVSTWGTDVIGNSTGSKTRRGVLAKKFLLAQAEEITATSNFLGRKTSKIAPKRKTIHVIPFGIDCNMFSNSFKKNKANDKLKIGFVKSLTPKYGPDQLIKAFCQILVMYPATRLIMVGHGPMDKDLKNLSNELGLNNNIEFKGYLNYSKIPKVLSDIDILIMPSTENSESFGVAAIEAQAMEIPVIASNIGGVKEAIIDGQTGILIEPGNIEQIARETIRLIKNSRLRHQMGEKGRKFVLNNFDIRENVLLFEKIYNNLVKPV